MQKRGLSSFSDKVKCSDLDLGFCNVIFFVIFAVMLLLLHFFEKHFRVTFLNEFFPPSDSFQLLLWSIAI